MRLQVEQLEKEKKERESRLRVIAKRIDHTERAYRQEERPLLAKDYELQQASDRTTFEQIQKGRIDAARDAHKRDLETKKRLLRMIPEFETRKSIIIEKRSAEYARKQTAAQTKIEEEKAKRTAVLLKTREEERLRQEAAERARHEAEELERKKEEGALRLARNFAFLVHYVILLLTSFNRGAARACGGGGCEARGGRTDSPDA
jgi:translation initiation factor 3 subunit A